MGYARGRRLPIELPAGPAPQQVTKITRDERGELLLACRKLMGSVLSLTGEETDAESGKKLAAATRRVEEAMGLLEAPPSAEPETGEVQQLATSLAKLYVCDMLADEERLYGKAVEPDGSREGFRGYTWAVSISDLLSFLQMTGKTGVLHVNIGAEVISLVLAEGDLVNAYSDNSPPGLRLGEILVGQGKLDQEQLEAFLLEFAFGNVPLGEALEAKGLIGKGELEEALEVQVRLIFTRLLCTKNAYFHFHTGNVDYGRPSRYSIMQLLLEACRIHDEAQKSVD